MSGVLSVSHLARTDNQRQAGLLTPGGKRSDLPRFPQLCGVPTGEVGWAGAAAIGGREWGFPVIGRQNARYSGASVAGFPRLPFSFGNVAGHLSRGKNIARGRRNATWICVVCAQGRAVA